MITEIGAHAGDGRPLLQVETQEEWRAWLERNHAGSTGVWLVSWKKASGKTGVAYGDTVDEALCFGWIDSRVNTLDSERVMRLFTPRNPKSGWSRINKDKIARLMREDRLTEAGARAVAAAQSNGAWAMYDEVEALVIPPDLAAALAADEMAGAYFARFSASSRKIILWWIMSARKPATRAARIAKTVELAAENRLANHPAGRDRGPRRRDKQG